MSERQIITISDDKLSCEAKTFPTSCLLVSTKSTHKTTGTRLSIKSLVSSELKHLLTAFSDVTA